MQQLFEDIVVSTSARMLTNSVILHDRAHAFLIDPAWLPYELLEISGFLNSNDLRVIGGFATHAHFDHLLWHPDFGDVPRLASPMTAALALTERQTLLHQLGDDFPPELSFLMGLVQPTETLDVAHLPVGFEAELVVHNGHCPGHTAIWLPHHQVLIVGDMLSDVELPLPFDPDDLPAYLAALDSLSDYCRRARYVVPGHGNVGTDPLARLDADRQYLDDVLRFGRSDDPRIFNAGMAQEYERLRRMVP